MKYFELKSETLLAMAAVLLASTAPNLFVISQAGYMKLSILARFVLVPSFIAMIGLGIFLLMKHRALGKSLFAGAAAGIVGTLGLELIRETGFHMGAMPGDLPKLMGVQIFDRFLAGPSAASNIAGWGYHFWNGASFGIIFTLVLGRMRWWAGPIFGLFIGITFMASPAVTALGIGRFGVLHGPGFAITVVLAHLAYGIILGFLASRWVSYEGLIQKLILDPFLSGRKKQARELPDAGN